MPTNTPNNYGQGRSEHQKDQKDAKQAFDTQKDKEAMSTSNSERERTDQSSQGKGGGAKAERDRDQKETREAGGRESDSSKREKEKGASDREDSEESEGAEGFVARARAKVGQLGSQAGERASDIGKYAYFNVGKFVKERPAAALGLSFAAGAFLGRKLFRRS